MQAISTSSKENPPEKRLALVRLELEREFAFLGSLGFEGPRISYENHRHMGDVFTGEYRSSSRLLWIRVVGGRGDSPEALKINFVSAMLWREPREDVFRDGLSVELYLKQNRPDIAGRIEALETKDRSFEAVTKDVLPIIAGVLRDELRDMVAGRAFEGCIESWS